MYFESILLILPAYNEEPTLPPLLKSLDEFATQTRRKLRILVIDDGSTDRTAALVGEAQGALDNISIELVQHEKNQGLGAAIRTGLREALQRVRRKECIAMMDADNSHPPVILESLVNKLEKGFEVTIASRYRFGAEIHGLTAFRKFLSVGAAAVYAVTYPTPGVRDFTCGYRAYHPQLLQDAFATYGDDGLVTWNGFVAMVELLLKLRAIGAPMAEVPLTLRYDLKESASKMRIFRNIKQQFQLLAEVPRRVKRVSAPLQWPETPGTEESSPEDTSNPTPSQTEPSGSIEPKVPESEESNATASESEASGSELPQSETSEPDASETEAS